MKFPEDFLNKTINDDCLNVLPYIPDKSIQMSFADPPYNLGLLYNLYKDKLSREEYAKWIKKWMNQLLRISKITIITPGNKNMFLYPEPLWVMAWIKKNSLSNTMLNSGRTPCINAWEPILWYGNRPVKSLVFDILEYNLTKQTIRKNHPCPKQSKLIEKLIECSSSPGDIVLDPFLGSGMTSLIAKKLKRNYIGIEIDKHYCDLTEEELKKPILKILDIEENHIKNKLLPLGGL
jgi:site-specific DNA-methyltransferase (adenine-specific)